MLILLFIIFVMLIILGIICMAFDLEIAGFLSAVAGVLGAVVTLIALVCCCVDLSKSLTIDKKINMYIEENAVIEQQIETVVKEYMEYEGKTLAELKGESSVTLVSLYPELKSDELIKTQIATYQFNNAKIKELKEIKIDAKIYKWWVYFGK